MNKEPSDNPKTPSNNDGLSDESKAALGALDAIEDIRVQMAALTDALEQYSEPAPHRKLKYIRNEEESIKKMPLVEKVLDLAFENQDLVTPEFMEKLWEANARYIMMQDICKRSQKIVEDLDKIYPEDAEPCKTGGTTTGV